MPTDLTPAELDAIEAERERALFELPEPGTGDGFRMADYVRIENALTNGKQVSRALRAAWEERDRAKTLVPQAFNEGWSAGRGSVSAFHGEYPNERQEAWENSDAFDRVVSGALTPPGEGATDG